MGSVCSWSLSILPVVKGWVEIPPGVFLCLGTELGGLPARNGIMKMHRCIRTILMELGKFRFSLLSLDL